MLSASGDIGRGRQPSDGFGLVNRYEVFFVHDRAMTGIAEELKPLRIAMGLVGAAILGLLVSLTYAGMVSVAAKSLVLLAVICLLAAAAFGSQSWRLAGATLIASKRGEAWQRAAIDGAGEAIIVIDDKATIVSFNRAAGRMFGYSAGEMIGTSLERLMTEGGRRAHAAYLAQHGVTAMVEAARLRTVHKGVRKRGDVFPFELTMTEWRDGDRRMFTGVMRDVTDQENAADALRESHARFVGLFENAAQPLFIFALSGAGDFVLETMNEAAETFVGASRFAAVGRTPDDLLGAEARELKRALLETMSTASAVSSTIRVPGASASDELPVIFTPLRNASGEIRAVLATGQVAGPKLTLAA
jgi:PAS domain S-box-containing protein